MFQGREEWEQRCGHQCVQEAIGSLYISTHRSYNVREKSGDCLDSSVSHYLSPNRFPKLCTLSSECLSVPLLHFHSAFLSPSPCNPPLSPFPLWLPPIYFKSCRQNKLPGRRNLLFHMPSKQRPLAVRIESKFLTMALAPSQINQGSNSCSLISSYMTNYVNLSCVMKPQFPHP